MDFNIEGFQNTENNFFETNNFAFQTEDGTPETKSLKVDLEPPDEESEETFMKDFGRMLQPSKNVKFFSQTKIPTTVTTREEKDIKISDTKEVQARKMVVNNIEVMLETIGEKQDEIAVNISYAKVRSYTNKVEKMDIKYDAPKQDNRYSLKPQIVAFCIMATLAGLFFMVKVNSYIVYSATNSRDTLELMIQSLTHETAITLSPFVAQASIMAFLYAFLAVAFIGFFVILTASDRNTSRVGREHGAARIAKPSDFKKYKDKFMEK